MQIVFCILLLALLLYRARPVRWNAAYIDKGSTQTINGLFIWLVFLAHFAQYSQYVRNYVGQYLGQLVVVMFLFYSGYGCMAQYMAKGADYLRQFPKKRILITLVNFDIAVALFVVVGLLFGKSFTLKQVALSFVCWDSVGNSNWYIFAIILCYVAFWLSFHKIASKVNETRRGGQILLIILFAIVIGLSRVKEPWWYDTMIVFGAGVVYAMNKERIEVFVERNYWAVLLALAAAFFALPYFPFVSRYHFAIFNMKSIVFALLVVLLTMKIEVSSPALAWCGRNLFPLYIYQRIPMIIFSTLHPEAFQDLRCGIYLILSALCAVAVASLYPRFYVKLATTTKVSFFASLFLVTMLILPDVN